MSLRSVYLARLSTVSAHSYWQFSNSGHSIQHTLWRLTFPQAVIKHTLRSTGHSSKEMNRLNRKERIGRPATPVLWANVANSVPPSVTCQTVRRVQVPTACFAASWLLDKERTPVHAAYSSALKTAAEENSSQMLLTMYQTIRCQSGYPLEKLQLHLCHCITWRV